MKEGYSADRLEYQLILLFLLVYTVGCINGFALGFNKMWFVGVQIAGAAFCFFLAWRLLRRSLSWFTGGLAEFMVSTVLAELPQQDFLSIDDIVISDRGNIDHVVIGRTGVWTIESKFSEEPVTIRNERLFKKNKWLGDKPLKQAYAQAAALSDFLGRRGCPVKKVNPILAFAGRTPDKATPNVMLKKVIIADYRSLVGIIGRKELPDVLTPEERRKIADAINTRRSTPN